MNSRERFFDLLEQVPRCTELWDKDANSLNIIAFEQALGVMSHGEVQMTKFFAAVWFNNNEQYGFDVVDAVARIDAEDRKLIAGWIVDPFWP
ncbi:MAG: hypothetical protein HN868_18920 [Gammaproteobacteria bacterium]|nr:hypothetical protein [Gammaproteobacteria bacterium]